MRSASTSEPSIAAWKASTSSGAYSRGRQRARVLVEDLDGVAADFDASFDRFGHPAGGVTWAPINIRRAFCLQIDGLTADSCSCQLNHASTTCR